MCCGYQGKRSITAWDKRQPRNLVRDPSVHWCLLSVPCGYWALTVFLRGFVLRLLCSSCAVTKRYWCPAEIAPKGPAGKTNCGSKEKAITEFSINPLYWTVTKQPSRKEWYSNLNSFKLTTIGRYISPFFHSVFYRIVEYGGLPYSNLPLHKCRQCE